MLVNGWWWECQQMGYTMSHMEASAWSYGTMHPLHTDQVGITSLMSPMAVSQCGCC